MNRREVSFNLYYLCIQTAPFVLEMPVYHLPTVQGVLRRCLERTWLFVKKITTIVMVVVLIVYLLMTFPGIGEDRRVYYESQADHQIQA
ncbi:MAG: hypothetical protein JRC60_08685, partial [Deltaproteobacteria bacterium]|nr:hypothetical protein [Deltaproteobacteria bacterium]